MRVKICGLLAPGDAEVASAAGADLLGVVFAPARRRRSLQQARAIFQVAPGDIERVGVFVDAPLAEVQDAIRSCRLDWAQLAGRETPAYCAALGGRVIKTLRLPADRAAFETYDVPLFHLDSPQGKQAGGTGKSWDYTLARDLAGQFPLLLAGGLTPENVEEAILTARPFGVDVSSGVETDGRKDPDKIVAFVENARAAFAVPCESA